MPGKAVPLNSHQTRKYSLPSHYQSIILLLFLVLTSLPVCADLALETETARIRTVGQWELSTAAEFQTSPDGKENAFPMALEYGASRRLELLFEPVPSTSIHPNGGKSATGSGDTEVTMEYLLAFENRHRPAIAIAGEVKFPTARNRQIGSGKRDYRLFAVASKRNGNVDYHFNLGYNITGKPDGVETKNPIDFSFAAEWFRTPKYDLLAEITYVGSSGGTDAEGATAPLPVLTPEIAGKEIVGSIGIRRHLRNNLDLFGTFSYDNNEAKLFRTGFATKF